MFWAELTYPFLVFHLCKKFFVTMQLWPSLTAWVGTVVCEGRCLQQQQQQHGFASFALLCGQRIPRGEKCFLHNRWVFMRNCFVHLTFLGLHFVLCSSASFWDAEGRVLLSQFANSSQPTLPSRCCTFSTSPEALNSRLSLNRTDAEPSALSAPQPDHLSSLLPKHGLRYLV